ncbi:MAG: Photosystem I assembly protein Ycf3 [Candidatus Argoarchaeum ethanivorans]|uniref:Photosystem I assembly protein Ycf3 n=1 Tax=Candidatus Argoarchaeum ethanivorans TaxID=2608793 RepID=A0A811TEJ6_9EURY|nr:MAG: Photosystem I assembly protein Ycf3 [Candidatus Argoarchaeum ethanivorans]
MINEIIVFVLQGSLVRQIIAIIIVVVGFIGAVIKILRYFQDTVLPFIRSKKALKEIFLYKKCKNLQPEDLGIQIPSLAKKEVYLRRDSDKKISDTLENSRGVLVTGVPKAGKTRSAYQAVKLIFPDFYLIKPAAEKAPDFPLPRLKKNYLIFFDDLNKFASVDFDFPGFVKKFREKSKKLVVLSTCRSGGELEDFKKKAMEFFRGFEIVNLDEYEISPEAGEKLAGDAEVEWKPEQFHGQPGQVILDDEDMKNRYDRLIDSKKYILRACKLLKCANIFTYEKDLIKSVCNSVFEINLEEHLWIDSLNGLRENSLITRPERSINKINIYDNILESIVHDYSPEDHLAPLFNLLINLKDAENLFYLGISYYFKNQAEDGVKCYREAIRINPGLAEAHGNLGILLDDLKRFGDAEKEYREAIRINPDYVKAHFNLGILLNDLKRFDEAEKELRETIRINPSLVEAHNNLGILLKDLKLFDEAEKEYREAIRLNPDDAEAHNNLGLLLKDLKRFGETEKEWREAIRINPDYAGAHVNLGVLFNDLKRFDEAEKEYRESIRINPDYAEAHNNLGILFLKTERPEDAKKELEIAKNLFKKQGKEEYVKKVDELLEEFRLK